MSKERIVKTEKVNTCNGWGFGGYFGKLHTYDNGAQYLDAKWSTRHSGTYAYKKYYDSDGMPIEKKEFEALFK